MRILGFILQKEFRQIFRDKTILAMMLAVPVIQLTILPLAMDFDIKSVNIAIVDRDHSSYSEKLTAKIASSGYFKITGYELSFNKALELADKGKADLILEIPAGFERSLVREGIQKIAVSVDAIEGVKAAIGSSYLRSVISSFNQDLNINYKTAVQNSPPRSVIDITYSNWFNPLAEYKYYMVPAILVILLTMIGGYITALNIVKEKEIGTIEQINVSPIKKWQFILGKLIPFWIIGMVLFTIGLLIAWIIYGVVSQGSLLVLYLFATVYLTAILGFGLLISTFSSTQVQAMFVAFFFMMIFMLMSGFFTSVDNMPGWAKLLASLTPVTHFIDAVRMIVLKGSGLSDVKMQFLYEVGFSIFLNSWAIYNYRKTA